MSGHSSAHTPEAFDVVVVGSGFGGSVAAYRAAAAGLSVCLLERGKAHPPGSFPRTPSAMSTNLWDPSEGLHGLFDLWSFQRTEAVVSAGLGGGSLIYANVLLRKDEHWFTRRVPGRPDQPWPVSRAELETHYEAVEGMLTPQPYPAAYANTDKTRLLQRAAQHLELDWSLPPLAVSFGEPAEPGVIFDTGSGNLHGAPRLTCRRCGECDLGCNIGSKNSLDLTYLSRLDLRYGEIRTNSEVRSFRPINEGHGGWDVSYVHHLPPDMPRRKNTAALPLRRIRARALVLAAGTLGTNYLLMANRSAIPKVSDTLGQGISGNGDFLALLSRTEQPAAASTGPVITSAIRVPDRSDGGAGAGTYVQDGGYPSLVDWVAELLPPTGIVRRAAHFGLLRAWQAATGAPPTRVSRQLARLLDSGRQSAGIAPLLAMGNDVPDSELSLHDGYLQLAQGDGSTAYVTQVRSLLQDIATEMGAEYHDYMSTAFSRYVTVHPLGGASMATDPQAGVADHHGQVFGYRGLYVADGSVMPGPVGPNPALTIAALADRFADHLIEEIF